MIQAYPVRCCCQPQKIFGWMILPANLRHGQRVKVQERPRLGEFETGGDRVRVTTNVHVIELKAFHDRKAVGDRVELFEEIAVYSDDRPIEFWRNIVGFRENT